MAKLSRYTKILIIYVAVIVLICAIFLGYVYHTTVIYEKMLPENYIRELIQNNKLKIDNSKVKNYINEKHNLNIEETLNNILKESELNKINDNTYELVNNSKVLGTITLKSIKKSRKLFILTIDEWEVKDFNYDLDNFYNTYKISVPENYSVKVNNKELNADLIISEDDIFDLGKLKSYVIIPKQRVYKIANLLSKPDIEITDESNKKVNFSINNNEVIVNKEYPTFKTYEDAKSKIKEDLDILSLAKNWSLFLTNDLGGDSHGFYKLSPYLVSGTDLYNLALRWSRSIDIEWISTHKLKDPVFTNEKVENCVFYTDKAFSCEVYLEKNMTISKQDKVDIMHDRLYFIYYKNSYKLIDLKSVVESE